MCMYEVRSFPRGNLSDIKVPLPPSSVSADLLFHISSQTSPPTNIMSLTQEISLPNGIKYEQPLGLYVLLSLYGVSS
jgi:hypothetical protein